MTIFGVALLAFCTLVGVFVGDLLGIVLGVKANVGGVGLAMMLLMAARVWLIKKGGLSHGIKLGVEFWATMYIPIVVAMAAQQNVVAAADGPANRSPSPRQPARAAGDAPAPGPPSPPGTARSAWWHCPVSGWPAFRAA